MTVISVYSIKGGVGKTAAAVNLAYEAARRGSKTMIWDMDPQAASSYYFRIKSGIKGSAEKLITSKKVYNKSIKATDYDNLDLMPADFSMRNMDIILNDIKKSGQKLKEVFKKSVSDYDIVFLDCPPGMTLLSENILEISDVVLIPIIPTTLSIRTLSLLESYINDNKMKDTKFFGFYSMVDRRKKLHRSVINEHHEDLVKILNTDIPYSSHVEQMGLYREPVRRSNPRCAPAVSYQQLWEEVQKMISKKSK